MAHREDAAGAFPRVPSYAWAWLQRSRPVLHTVAERLTGAPPSPGFVEALRASFETDAFTRSVVADVVAEVAFSGRVPTARPAGASWDRGLTWWAAALAGTTPAEFESRTAPAVRQRRLFGDEDVRPAAPPPRRYPPRPPSEDRMMLVRALRELLAASDGDAVPAASVRQLLALLEGEGSAPPR